MAKHHPAHVGLAGRCAQTPAIRRRLGEWLDSTYYGRSDEHQQGR